MGFDDDGARPLSQREQREFDALACRLDQDTPGPDLRRRTRLGMAATAICVVATGLAFVLGFVLAAGFAVVALGALLGAALTMSSRRRSDGRPPR